MEKPRKPVFTLLMLVLIFCLPGIVAYWFFLHPEWLLAAKTNKGALLNPPYALSVPQDKGKWHLYYWHPGKCDTLCLGQLDRLARSRLALGRKLYDVDLQWLRSDNSPDLPESLLLQLRQQDISVQTLNAKDSRYLLSQSQDSAVYIGNPDTYLILAYNTLNKPMDVYHDLKHLLSLPVQKGKPRD